MINDSYDFVYYPLRAVVLRQKGNMFAQGL